jgi:hypothetical protein
MFGALPLGPLRLVDASSTLVDVASTEVHEAMLLVHEVMKPVDAR